ncbi:hypothetical protein L227DRAFT_406513 [Lentinus tigrinus ALCF2SS1-6]|uniref:Uncharacterized protein n=1 Tax=Lentinus tigrinus ALCF2SS1-6 TaxID=1328759 RepID=A0A5C2RPV6_9APHY|nr:hypothetical protein L227DRAFT_406513 [Lentinus tigrinus ALCF2SS1-6]
MSVLSYPNARFLGLWLELFATGAYFVYLSQCVDIVRSKLREGMSLWLPFVCALMFVNTMLVVISNMIAAYEAFSSAGPGQEINPWNVYADVGSTLSEVKSAATVFFAIISDLIIVYRTFVVWGSRIRVVLVPIALLLGGIGIWSAWSLAQTDADDDPIYATVSIRARYLFIVTFALNVLCAGLICWKIWDVLSELSAHISTTGRGPTSRAFEVIIETAALYCTNLLGLVVSDFVGSNLFFVFLDLLPPVTALAFTILIVRTRPPRRLHTTTTPSTWLSFWHAQSGTSPTSASSVVGAADEVLTVLEEVPFTAISIDVESADGRLKSRCDGEAVSESRTARTDSVSPTRRLYLGV